jgi:probable DNA metabolism protein
MILIYDDTFEGFLSVVFECYRRKIEPTDIRPESFFQESLFVYRESIPTHPEHADRVWNGLQKKLNKQTRHVPFSAFLSRDEGIELALYRFIRLSFEASDQIGDNYADPDVLTVRKASRKVMKEAMRMVEFVRFQLTLDNIYFAAISPDYDVMPIVMQHFRNRFANQQWIVYDLKRDYGFYYNIHGIEEVTLSTKAFNAGNGAIRKDMLQEGEIAYQTMWNEYCRSITIRERLNLKVHRQHLPKRYWKFLPEKGAGNIKL